MYSSTSSILDTPSKKYNTSVENISAAYSEIVSLLGFKNVISSFDVRLAHSNTPWSPAAESPIAAFVVYPSSTSHVSEIMKICSRRRIPAVGYSGGSSFHGALTATRGGICVDFKNMNGIVAVHPEGMDVVVQPALEWLELNAHLANRGLFFPPDPGPDARIGGMIATNCSGTNAYRHGTMKAWVISLTVVLADGTIVKTRQRPRKSSAGYDLTSLLVGSEGTLGLVTEAVLRVTSAPKNLHVVVAPFPSTHLAVKAVMTLIGSGLPIDALDLLDKPTMIALNISGLSSKQWQESPTLFLKFSGSNEAVRSQIEFTRQEARNCECEAFEVSAQESEIALLWGARKATAKALKALRKESTDLFLHADAVVPISHLAEIMEESFQVATAAGLFCSTVGHVGDGNFHAAIVCSKSQEEKAKGLIDHIQRRAVELEGTITGEHGIGLDLRENLVYELGENGLDMMRRIKLALDPQCVLNPDKVVRLDRGL